MARSGCAALFLACLMSAGRQSLVMGESAPPGCEKLKEATIWCGQEKEWKNSVQVAIAALMADPTHLNLTAECIVRSFATPGDNSFCTDPKKLAVMLQCSRMALLKSAELSKKYAALKFHTGYEHCVKTQIGLIPELMGNQDTLKSIRQPPPGWNDRGRQPDVPPYEPDREERPFKRPPPEWEDEGEEPDDVPPEWEDEGEEPDDVPPEWEDEGEEPHNVPPEVEDPEWPSAYKASHEREPPKERIPVAERDESSRFTDRHDEPDESSEIQPTDNPDDGHIIYGRPVRRPEEQEWDSLSDRTPPYPTIEPDFERGHGGDRDSGWNDHDDSINSRQPADDRWGEGDSSNDESRKSSGVGDSGPYHEPVRPSWARSEKNAAAKKRVTP